MQQQTSLALAIAQAKAKEAEAKAKEAEVTKQIRRDEAVERGIVFVLIGGFIAYSLDKNLEAAQALLPIFTYFFGVATNHYFRR